MKQRSETSIWRHWLKVARGTAASTVRGWQGMVALQQVGQPPKLIVLYEFEACPYCRLVREVLTELGLDVDIRPCPKGGKRFRPEAKALGGKAQFPFLVDENTGAQLYESDRIVQYLYATYAKRPVPARHRLRNLQLLGSYLNTAVGGADGFSARASRQPEKPLILYGFEASPFTRPVRERLCELEIPYTSVSLGKEQWADAGVNGIHASVGPYAPVAGGKRERFLNAHHKMMVPYLEDPNTGKGLFESRDILAYLEKTYAQ